jgi:hypothetical protein
VVSRVERSLCWDEIWDIEVVGQRVFIAGTFSSLQNTTGNTAVVNQRFLASYNYQTGLIDTGFRPTFGGAGSPPWRPRRTAPGCTSPARSTPSTA